MQYFNGSYLFTTPTTNPSIWFDILTVFFAVLLVIGALAFWRRARLAPGNPVLRRFIRRVSQAAMWTAAIALFFVLMRDLQIPYLGMPIWLDLDILLMIGLAGYYVYDLSERYPAQVWEVRSNAEARRFRPQPRRRAEPQKPRPAVRGKRRSGRR